MNTPILSGGPGPSPRPGYGRREWLRFAGALAALTALSACARAAGAPATAAPGGDAATPAAARASATLATTSTGSPARGTPCAATDTGDGDDPAATVPIAPPDTPATLALLRAGDTGERLVLSGVVSTTACAPLAGATVLVVHASAAGDYQGPGGQMLYQGVLLTDARGRYAVTTIKPGRYRDSPVPHVHLTVGHPGRGRPFGVTVYFADAGDIGQLSAKERAGVVPLRREDGPSGGVLRGVFDIVVPMG